ncbi:hypothetical protein B7759_01152 [Burkholderia glumae]|nr:hypothetical protein B7759_01152 [Burkholderia glumae]
MTSDWLIAGVVIVATIVGFVVLGLIGGIKGKQDDNKDHN